MKKQGRTMRRAALSLAACAWTVLGGSAALAHGVASGNNEGAFTPLFFVPAVIALALFLVLTHSRKGWNVLVVGGAGYVGSNLVLALLEHRHRVTVLDRYPHGGEALSGVRSYPDLREVEGDFRDPEALAEALRGCDAVIQLAPACGGPAAGPDSLRRVVRAARESGVRRFIYASSFAVYGDTGGAEATEETPPAPATEVGRQEALCEKVVAEERAPGFAVCVVRPAAVCGGPPRPGRQGLVGRFTFEALERGRVRVPDGDARHPSIHVADMVRLYLTLLDQPDARIDGRTYNAVGENQRASELAELVKAAVGRDVVIEGGTEAGAGSCALSGERMREELGFVPRHGVADAVRELAAHYRRGGLSRPSALSGEMDVPAIGRARVN